MRNKDNYFIFFLAVSILVNRIEINSSVSFNIDSNFDLGSIKFDLTIIFNQTYVSLSSLRTALRRALYSLLRENWSTLFDLASFSFVLFSIFCSL